MANPLQDPRFAHLSWDPKFNRVPKRERKVKIDDRFKSMFNESKFQSKTKVDKRGRPLRRTTNEDLKRYYDLSSSNESENDDDDDEIANEKSSKKKISGRKPSLNHFKTKGKEQNLKSDSEEIDEDGSDGFENDDEGEIITKEKSLKKKVFTDSHKLLVNDQVKTKKDKKQKQKSDSEETDEEDSESSEIRLDLARGDGNFESSSDEGDDDSEWSFQDDEKIPEHQWGELDSEAPRNDQATRRLAVCNMDWDRIKAKDLLVLFNSFKPPLGMIKSVTIYPSEFGLRRMEEEQTVGPKELLEKSDDDDSEASGNSEPEENDEKDDDAKIVYREKLRKYQLNRLKYYYAVVECDTVETANSIYESCDGIEYESSATKLDLRFIPDDMTFDQSSPKDEAKDLGDLSSYKPTLFRNAALQQSKVELTWEEPDVHRKELVKRAFEEEGLDSIPVHDLLAPCSSDEEEGEENEQILTSEKKFTSNVPPPVVQENKLNKKKKKPQKKQTKKIVDDEDFFNVNVADPRFSAMYTSHLYNVDPSDPAYKKTKNMDALVREKLNRIPEDKLKLNLTLETKDSFVESPKISNKSSADLSLLIKSVKSKTEVWHRSKKLKKK